MPGVAVAKFTLLAVLGRHYKFLKSLRPLPYVGVIVAENVVFSITVGYATVLLFGRAAARHFDLPYLHLFFLATTVGPLIETLVAQLIPYELISALGLSRVPAFFVSWAIFVAIHISSGIGSALTAGVCAGFYLSITYFIWRRVSTGRAYFMTFLCHAFYNAILIGFSFFK